MINYKKYEKYKNELSVGMELYCKYRGTVRVVRIEENSFLVCESGNGPEVQRYCDMGKILFFSKDDYKAIDRDLSLREKYEPYQKGTIKGVKDKIEEENRKFFIDKSYHESEKYYEQQHLDQIQDEVEKKYSKAKAESEGFSKSSNGNSETYDPDYAKERRNAENKKEYWENIFNRPYFAEVIEKGCKPVYIGEKAIEGEVIDSRDKKYANLLRMNSYYEDSLDLVRKFDIFRRILNDFYDDYNIYNEESAVGDEFLLKIIQYNRDRQEVVSIARTIKEEQHKIIMRPPDENFVVEGCAGSGKTMILLHRLSSLIFNEENLNEENLILVSPNNVLDRESNAILKDLELKNITKGSINSLYRRWADRYVREWEINTQSYNSLDRIITDNTLADADTINFIYNKDIAADFDNTLVNVLKNPEYEEGDFRFARIENERIEMLVADVFGAKVEQDSEVFKRYAEMNDKYERVCEELSRENVFEKIKKLKVRIGIEKKKLDGYNKTLLTDVVNEHKENIRNIKNQIGQKENELFHLFKAISDVPVGDTENEKAIHREEKRILLSKISDIEKETEALKIELNKKEKEYKTRRREIIDDQEYHNLRRQYKALELFYHSGDLKGEQVKTAAGELSVAGKLFTGAFDFYNDYDGTVPNEIIERNGTFGEFVHNNHVAMNRVRRYQKFQDGNVEEYIIDIIGSIMYDWKNTLEIDQDKFYDFELYYALRGMAKVYGHLDKENKLISVDEYQDYATIEMELLEKLFPNCTFNLYGEMLQNVNAKGITKLEDNKYIEKYELYKLNVNYRNGKEITEYINENFNTDMRAIGIPSIVDFAGEPDLKSLEISGKKRVALIVKSEDEYDILKYDKRNDNLFKNDEVKIQKDKLNVVPIRFAKGLEFEEVYVLEQGMNKNEKYVASTRALEALHIIVGD